MTTHATQYFLDGLVAPPGGGGTTRSRPSPRRKWRRASFGSAPVADRSDETPIEAAAYCTCTPIPRTPEQAVRHNTGVVEPPQQGVYEEALEQGVGKLPGRPASPLLFRTVPHNGGGGFKLRNGAKLRAPSPVGIVSPQPVDTGAIEEALLDVHAAQFSPPRPVKRAPAFRKPQDSSRPSGIESGSFQASKPILYTTPEPLPDDLSAQIAAIVKAITAPPTMALDTCQAHAEEARPSSVEPSISKVSSYEQLPLDVADQEAVLSQEAETESDIFKDQLNVACKGLQTVAIPDIGGSGGSSRPPGTTVRVRLVAENTVPFEERKWVKVHRKTMTQDELRRHRYEQQLKHMFPALPQVSGTVLHSPLNLLRRSAEDSPRVWR
mmetsp:Transcript_11057/g.20089  ORF Transcript_11057/g.20089 Transcript_11057/m.20089 type:complete len:380 (+) Transcript_11057:121-1260(+)